MINIPLTEQAYKLIEHKIVTLQLKPNAFITEKSLCEITGFGRMPIHEACGRLEAAHLIKISPRKGMYVSSINKEEIFQQIELRRAIEPILMKNATQNALVEERAELLKLKQAFFDASEKQDVDATVQIDGEFNQLVSEISRNPFVRDAILPLWALARRMYYMNYHVDIMISSKIDRAHCDLMQSIATCELVMVYDKTMEILDYVELLYKRSFISY